MTTTELDTMSTTAMSTSQGAPTRTSCERMEAVPTHMQRAALCFVAGGVALSTAFAVMHPLDSLKTQRQAATTTVKPKIGLRGLFRGFTTSVVGAAPQGGLRLATYELVRSALLHRNQNASSTIRSDRHGQSHHIPQAFVAAVAAVAGDTVSSVVKVPREVITARLQTGHYDTHLSARGGSATTSTAASGAVRAILREEGVSGLFRGFWAATARDWPFMVILFSTYETFKQHHHRVPPFPSAPSSSRRPDPASSSSISSVSDDADQDDSDDVTIPTIKSTVFGGISGALAGFLTTPFDVIKTRIVTHRTSPASTDAVSKTSVGSRTPSIWAVARQIWVEMPESTSAARAARFFVGGGARALWWFCVCSIFFPVYEGVKETLRPVVIRSSREHASTSDVGRKIPPLTGTLKYPASAASSSSSRSADGAVHAP